jgi:hypothetical protein
MLLNRYFLAFRGVSARAGSLNQPSVTWYLQLCFMQPFVFFLGFDIQIGGHISSTGNLVDDGSFKGDNFIKTEDIIRRKSHHKLQVYTGLTA